MNLLARLFHRHRWVKVDGTMRAVGVTLGWDMRPATEYALTWRCACGAEEARRGFCVPRGFDPLDLDVFYALPPGERLKLISEVQP